MSETHASAGNHHEPERYEIRLKGYLDNRWADWFDSLTITRENNWSGLSAMVAGIIFAGIQPIHPPDVLASVSTSLFIIITSFKTVMSLFGLFGITGLYARQVEEIGWRRCRWDSL